MRRQWLLVVSFLLLFILLIAGCGIPQDQYDMVLVDLEDAQRELLSVKTELAASQSKVSNLTSSLDRSKADLDAAKEKLVKLEEVYPPRDFSSSTELRDWLAANGVSESQTTTIAESLYTKALQIQEDALRDGYIISVDLDPGKEQNEWYITCVTIIDGDLWAWGPESDEPLEVSSMINFMKVK